MKWKGLPLLIFGSGGISKETYNLVKQINEYGSQQIYDFLGFVENDMTKIGNEVIDGYKIVICDEELGQFIQKFSIMGLVIPIGNPKIKLGIFNKIKNLNKVVYPNIIHPSVQFDRNNVKLGFGNILTAGVKLTCDIKIGNFNLINLNSAIGHDTEIGDFNVINSLSQVSGNVKIKNGCLIGTGAKILQQLIIHENAIIGAGAVVVKNVEENSTVVGIPAKRIK